MRCRGRCPRDRVLPHVDLDPRVVAWSGGCASGVASGSIPGSFRFRPLGDARAGMMPLPLLRGRREGLGLGGSIAVTVRAPGAGRRCLTQRTLSSEGADGLVPSVMSFEAMVTSKGGSDWSVTSSVAPQAVQTCRSSCMRCRLAVLLHHDGPSYWQ